MLRFVRALFSVILVFGLLGASANAQITRILKPGASGEEVKILQSFLKKLPGIYPEGIVSGFYGPATQKAVRRFQGMIGLEVVGVVGPKTAAKINTFLNATAPSLAPAKTPQSAILPVLPAPAPAPPPAPPSAALSSLWTSKKISAFGKNPAIAWNGRSLFATWSDKGSIYSVNLDQEGKRVGDVSVVMPGFKNIFEPRFIAGETLAGTTTTNYAMAWVGDLGFGNTLYFAHFDKYGVKLAHKPVNTPTENALGARPALVWNGKTYLSVWPSKSRGIFFTKLRQALADPASLVIDSRIAIDSATVGGENQIVDAAWNGSVLGVVWLDSKDSVDPSRRHVYFATLDAEGSLVKRPLKVSGVGGLTTSYPIILADGTNFVILWQESGMDGVNINSGAHLFFTKLSSAGTAIVKPRRITMIPFSIYGGYNSRPNAAKSGNSYVVSWTFSQETASPPKTLKAGPGAIYIKVLDSNGNMTKQDELISIAAGDNDFSYVAAKGAASFVVWRNQNADADSILFAYRSATTTAVLTPLSSPQSSLLANIYEAIIRFLGWFKTLFG